MFILVKNKRFVINNSQIDYKSLSNLLGGFNNV